MHYTVECSCVCITPQSHTTAHSITTSHDMVDARVDHRMMIHGSILGHEIQRLRDEHPEIMDPGIPSPVS